MTEVRNDGENRLGTGSVSCVTAPAAVRAIAFYLPQFHAIAENDHWWGSGFTDWVNVRKAQPLFPGHYQPQQPALGYYDPREANVREAQAELAAQNGIYGFCYYDYWFSGRRLLEKPIEEVLRSGKPDFPFCLCWANENWTRRWDGLEHDVLIEQTYSDEDDENHIKALLPYFLDCRYIKVNGRPLFLVYRTDLLPDPAKTAQRWRSIAKAAGLSDLYLVRAESFQSGISPESLGFDAAVEFAPDRSVMGQSLFRGPAFKMLRKIRFVPSLFRENWAHSYQSIANAMVAKPHPAYKRFLGVCPSWDNSPRRSADATILLGSTPSRYEQWCRTVVQRTIQYFEGDERLIFINAWNEWAEGCHLEPDTKFGAQYLEATKRAVYSAQ